MPGLSRRRTAVDIWPGFVDALATLLMVIIFLLMIFVIAQFYLGEALSGRDQALDRLNREVSELADLLALEKTSNTDLQSSVSQLSAELQSTLSERDELASEVNALRGIRDSLTTRLGDLQDRSEATEAERNRVVDALAAVEAMLAQREAALAATRDTLAQRELTLEDTLAMLAQREAALDSSETRLAEREATLEETLALLAQRETALRSSESRLAEREATIVENLALLARRDATLESTERELTDREIQLAAIEAVLAQAEADLEERRKALEEAAKKIVLSDAAMARSEQMLADSAAELTRRMKELEAANKTIEADRETVEFQLKELAELRQDIIAMVAYREELENQLQEMMKQARTGEAELTQEREISAAAKAQLALLNRQISQLRRQIGALNDALEASESLDREQKTQIADLGKRLNAALAAKVQELSRYRSEFFGRLRDLLGDRADIRIVGDRFVFQSEVLFSSGSAELGQAGKAQMAALARTLADIARRIPADVDWVLRVDGHTDKQPIHTDQFPSNWELSTARAISVVRFLQQQGIPPNRLAATGFGEYQPLDSGDTLDVLNRNRRIELKLTQR